MINRIFFLCFFCFFYISTYAQLEVFSLNNDATPLESLENLIISDLLGCNVQVSNIQFSGNLASVGGFNYYQNNDLCEGQFNLDRGVLMSTGMIDYAIGPNNDGDTSQEWGVQYEDPFVNDYLVDFGVITESADLYDASVLEFDLVASSFISLDFEVIFGSEEYVEWMSPFYADAFCFFVSESNSDIDPNFDLIPQNIMETGSILNISDDANLFCNLENKPISAWTIRPYSEVFNVQGLNECLYVDNQNGQFCDAIGYDGYTTPMLFSFNMIPEAQYHVKIVIVDGAGPALDSGVFLRKSNINANPIIDFIWGEPDYNNVGGATVAFSNISTNNVNFSYFWDFNGDGDVDSTDPNPIYTFDQSGNYIVTLEVLNDCTGLTSSISYDIIIPSVYLDDFTNSSVSVFPNPSKDVCHINISDPNQLYLVDVFDISGRFICNYYVSIQDSKIDVSNLDSGVYFLYVRNEFDLVFSERLIIL